eukprot:CAMPEP_0167822340 /NCGR_PEP_ID=MMETSP0112_2-20121227/7424_1 /TAXON_ID=91324 /ORGANISM="Lotharella globosa, Strain CCCM811" /LENGTH=369 /DNA_ID=CAMNT_0007723661 /DNA_START=57 /DNA_END=1167 /DNA_ORIENTATION=-
MEREGRRLEEGESGDAGFREAGFREGGGSNQGEQQGECLSSPAETDENGQKIARLLEKLRTLDEMLATSSRADTELDLLTMANTCRTCRSPRKTDPWKPIKLPAKWGLRGAYLGCRGLARWVYTRGEGTTLALSKAFNLGVGMGVLLTWVPVRLGTQVVEYVDKTLEKKAIHYGMANERQQPLKARIDPDDSGYTHKRVEEDEEKESKIRDNLNTTNTTNTTNNNNTNGYNMLITPPCPPRNHPFFEEEAGESVPPSPQDGHVFTKDLSGFLECGYGFEEETLVGKPTKDREWSFLSKMSVDSHDQKQHAAMRATAPVKHDGVGVGDDLDDDGRRGCYEDEHCDAEEDAEDVMDRVQMPTVAQELREEH